MNNPGSFIIEIPHTFTVNFEQVHPSIVFLFLPLLHPFSNSVCAGFHYAVFGHIHIAYFDPLPPPPTLSIPFPLPYLVISSQTVPLSDSCLITIIIIIITITILNLDSTNEEHEEHAVFGFLSLAYLTQHDDLWFYFPANYISSFLFFLLGILADTTV
jgi:hypothetical protein